MASHPSFTTVADIYLAGKIQNISPKSPTEPASSSQSKQAPVSLTEQEVAQYQGTFQESDGTIWKLAPKEGKLEALVQGFTFQLVPMSRTHFVAVASLNTSELLPYAFPATAEGVAREEDFESMISGWSGIPLRLARSSSAWITSG